MTYFKPNYRRIFVDWGFLIFLGVLVLFSHRYLLSITPPDLAFEFVSLLGEAKVLMNKVVDGKTAMPLFWIPFLYLLFFVYMFITCFNMNEQFFREIDMNEHDFIRSKHLKWVL